MSREFGHFPSDASFGNVDDGTRNAFEDGCYLADEGTPDCHTTGLFDQDTDAFGEHVDLATGESFLDGQEVSEIDGLTVVSDIDQGLDKNDAAARWLLENS